MTIEYPVTYDIKRSDGPHVKIVIPDEETLKKWHEGIQKLIDETRAMPINL